MPCDRHVLNTLISRSLVILVWQTVYPVVIVKDIVGLIMESFYSIKGARLVPLVVLMEIAFANRILCYIISSYPMGVHTHFV